MDTEQSKTVSIETAIATMSTDIHWMKEALKRMETIMAAAASNYVTHIELEAFKAAIIKVTDDHEERLRAVETMATRTAVWGSVALLGLGALEMLATHLWGK